jgi:hypothetical protein
MTTRDSLALRAQAERARAVKELCEQGHTPKEAWALVCWRQEREERGMREPWALRETRVAGRQRAVRPDPPRWAMYGAAAIVAAFAGIVLGVAWLIVQHAPKVLGRLGF